MSLVPVHPEATADPQVVRWVVPAGTLPLVGPVADVPADLAALVRCGDIATIAVEPRAVVIGLAPGRRWAGLGAAVRDALSTALQRPGQWRPAAAVSEDDVLRAALEETLAGPAGDYIRSHGGAVTMVAAADRCAEVRMTGTCEHCPAAGFTLHARLERELRSRFPALVELRATEAGRRHQPPKR